MKVKRDYNFTIVPDALIEADLDIYAKMVYLVIARHADKEAKAFPGYERIQKLAGCGKNRVVTGIQALEEAGWMSHQRTGRSSLYTLRSLPRKLQKSSRQTSEVYQKDTKDDPSKEDPKKDMASPPSPKPDKKCTEYYYEKHRATQGIPPQWNGKTGSLLKQDIRRLQEIEKNWFKLFKTFVDIFLEDKNRRIAKFTATAGYGYNVFHGMLDQMIYDYNEFRRSA